MEPRWVSVTAQPSAVRIEMVFPFDGREPAKLTRPAAGAATAEPRAPPTSIPRWPDEVYAPPP
jgi:hypothetical protein